LNRNHYHNPKQTLNRKDKHESIQKNCFKRIKHPCFEKNISKEKIVHRLNTGSIELNESTTQPVFFTGSTDFFSSIQTVQDHEFPWQCSPSFTIIIQIAFLLLTLSSVSSSKKFGRKILTGSWRSLLLCYIVKL